jgi:hypothetical protein
MFLRYVGSYKSHTASHPRRRHSSFTFFPALTVSVDEMSTGMRYVRGFTQSLHLIAMYPQERFLSHPCEFASGRVSPEAVKTVRPIAPLQGAQLPSKRNAIDTRYSPRWTRMSSAPDVTLQTEHRLEPVQRRSCLC